MPESEPPNRPYRAAGRFVPTDDSLEFAGKISRLMGLPFDRDETARTAETLYETQFKALLAALDLPPDTVSFHPEVYWLTSAFADAGEEGEGGGGRVFLDENFDLWLFALSHYSVIAACKLLDDEAFAALASNVASALRFFRSAHLRDRVLAELAPTLEDHADCLNLSGGVARALLMFVLCHEIAHCRLGHHDRPVDPALELEADRDAAASFAHLIAKGPHIADTPVYVDPKLAGVPVILPRWLELYEARMQALTGRAPGRRTHPAPSERVELLSATLRSALNETAAMLLDGLESAVADLRSALAPGAP